MNKSNRPVDAGLYSSFGQLIINPLYVGSIVLSPVVLGDDRLHPLTRGGTSSIDQKLWPSRWDETKSIKSLSIILFIDKLQDLQTSVNTDNAVG